ncbi:MULTISPECIES: hypothetical protein [unclassified Mesorhizobium]|uniref:hypothetical protein n=1 Tax=unclassified Mesorhizobium TaxID=325217 RepID=UPI00112AC0A9|nr:MULTISPECIES: hypothetical protein [unclassified Mesorhizobium]MBZ9798657.1 hypothetical protein [Mesorhizobium sp. ES1-4]TPK55810.1 hypothetical protein FJ546_28740 [Mesorhizobium sp. B2-4-19]
MSTRREALFGAAIGATARCDAKHARTRSEAKMKIDSESEEVIEEWPSLVFSTEAASGAKADNTLLPMLIAGLALIVLGGVVVMAFV